MKVASKNTVFWCWIWALIYTNHFYNLNWLKLDHTMHQHAFQYHSGIWAVFLKNINNLQPWTKLLRQNRKSIFQWKNLFSLKSMLFGWRIRNFKNWNISWAGWILNFCLKIFCPGLLLCNIWMFFYKFLCS